MDPVRLARDLVRCHSVTPADGGAQDVLINILQDQGFIVTKLKFGEIENFFAERPGPGPHLCFAGHTDVVPPGEGWAHDPFEAEEIEGIIYGRGAVDMKGSIAAFCSAAAEMPGHISFLITGDEEGEAVNGTVKVLEWMREQDRIPDFCVVGEPTSTARVGDVVKIGRRGSMNAVINMPGRQGHAAYPHLADNAVHKFLPVLAELAGTVLDEGNEYFPPSSLQITSVDVGNPVTNVIPGLATARLNIRFNDRHTGASLTAWLRAVLDKYAPEAEMVVSISGEAFLTKPGKETEMLTAAITAVTGITPERNTAGGTSDARFIARYCPVAEFGLVNATMHKVNEAVPIADLLRLTEVYKTFSGAFCGRAGGGA
jgi:succinyl-diaminopimelate desuccinylase